MGIGISFASGFLKGLNDVAREKNEKLLKEQEAKAERQKMLGGWVVELIKSDNVDTTSEGFRNIATEAGLADLVGVANKISDINKTDSFGTYILPLVDEYKFSGTGGNPYSRSQVFWNSWQRHLAKPERFDEAVQYFKQNDTAREQLFSAVRKNEDALRMGNIKSQSVSGIKAEGLRYIDIEQDYGFATKLFDELGFTSVEDEVNVKIASSQIDFDPNTEIPVMFNTGPEKNIPMAISKETYTTWESMATRGGFKNVQEFVHAFGYTPGQKPADMSLTEFAAQQNSVLFKAAEIYNMGYGDMLANPARMNTVDVSNLLKELDNRFGKNNSAKIQALSAMVGTPAEAQFRKVRKSRYSKNETRSIQAAVTGQAFVESLTGLKKDEFDEGFKAQKEAVLYLDRLAQIEEELGKDVGTGWTRAFAGGLKAVGIQVKQAGNLIGDIFSNNRDFNSLDSKTSLADLEATIKLVDPRIDLAKISEADAIRLTLAAKMARAVDPAGRLSNQDFEIQLRRLGSFNLSTPESVQAAIRLVRNEFAQDLEYKQLLKGVIDNTTTLTRQTAREVQAAMTLRNLQGYVYGGARGTEVTQAADESKSATGNLEGFAKVPGLQTKDGGEVYYADGVYKDASGNEVNDVIETPETEAQ